MTKELAEEIEQDNQSHDGSGSDTETTSQSNALEVIKVEEEYSDSLKEELLRKRPHGCIARVPTLNFMDFFSKFLCPKFSGKITWSPLNIAVYSNRKTFQFCQKWLQLAVLEDHAAFKGLPVSVLMATDHELDDFDKNVLIKGKNKGLDSSKTTSFA